LDEARRQLVLKMAEEARQKGWANPGSLKGKYMELYEALASLHETVIIFGREVHRHAALHEAQSGQTTKTAFLVTDQSFIFLRPAGLGFRGQRSAVARRVPFDEVKSLTVDAVKDDFVISFAGGQARVNLHDLLPETSLDRARGLVHYFKPFLPLRLQQGW